LQCIYTTINAKRKTFIRKIKQSDKVRYAEVWNERRGKKVIQHHVRYLESDPSDLPEQSSFHIENLHFGYLGPAYKYVPNLAPHLTGYVLADAVKSLI